MGKFTPFNLNTAIFEPFPDVYPHTNANLMMKKTHQSQFVHSGNKSGSYANFIQLNRTVVLLVQNVLIIRHTKPALL